MEYVQLYVTFVWLVSEVLVFSGVLALKNDLFSVLFSVSLESGD